MKLLEREVEKTLALNTNSQYYLYYGISPDNFHFAILATKGLWYKNYVFANLEGRQIDTKRTTKLQNITHFTSENLANLLGFPETKEEQKISMGHTEHTTEEGIKNRIEQCKAEIESGLYNSIFPIRLTNRFDKNFYFMMAKQPSEAVADPDSYLQSGDILSNCASPPRYGIYIGNGEIVLWSSNGKPEIGSLSRDFANSNEGIEKLIFPYRLREPDKIVEIAKGFVDSELQKDEYQRLYENPQNFITRAALGLELPLGQGIIQNLLQKMFKNS